MDHKIIIGADVAHPLYTFTGATLKNCSLALCSSLVGEELAYDVLTPTAYTEAYLSVVYGTSEGEVYLTTDGSAYRCAVDPGSNLRALPYGTPIRYYADGVLMGKFYSKTVERISATDFEISAVSAVGILDGQTHNGGLYTGQLFPQVAADIIGAAIPFSCSDAVAGIQVFGWVPVATRRENLHQLLFSSGVSLLKDSNGDVLFDFLGSSTVKEVPDSRIFQAGSVVYETPASRVEVTEHAYLALDSDTVSTLYDNTDGSGAAHNTRVEFPEAPIHDLTASGTLVIHESGVNYAVVSGTGTLTGKAYSHTMRIVSRETESPTAEQKTVTVTEATLVSALNSNAVADRVFTYYSAAQTVNSELMVVAEKPGDRLMLNTPYLDQVTAFLASMDISASSFLRASCELIAGYVPPGGGQSEYTRCEVLTGSGTWHNVNSATKARIVLVGGAQGGSAGHNGATASGSVIEWNGSGAGSGGEPGTPGLGGLILVEDVDLTEIESLEYSCGSPGQGGAPGSTPSAGTDGTATTLGDWSSANGARSNVGVTNLFTGEVYGKPGSPGIAGAKGSDTTGSHTLVYKGITYYPGTNAAARSDGDGHTAYGGYGGGPAAGSNGENGKSGTFEYVSGRYDCSNGGDAGDGADAVAPDDNPGYGNGGNAGNGGGGGGIGGQKTDYAGHPGAGGSGSRGGNAGAGIALIYT